VSDKLVVQLNTNQVTMEPGGAPFELVTTVQNLGDVVDQYTVELTGLEREWFTASVTSVGIFPGDREQVRIQLHPPKRPGLRAGAYPFRINVRSRGDTLQESADGVLQVRGMAVYRVDITPRRLTARGKGSFKVQIANTGNADVKLALDGRDAENACRIDFPEPEPLVTAGNKKEVSVRVRPNKRPWVGPEKAYDFTVTARPQDAGGEPQTVAAQFTHKPLFGSWSPLFTLGKIAVVVIVLIGLVAILGSIGVLGSAPQAFASSTSRVQGFFCNAPLIDRVCPDDYHAFKSADNQSVATTGKGGCKFEFGFKDFAEAEPKLVGDCTSSVYYDHFGNGVQYTREGMLFWQKDSNTIYFYRSASVWGYIQGHSQLLYGSGAI
jgi:hypothetical protein